MPGDIKVLSVDAGNAFYRMDRYRLGDFFGPVDLGLHLSAKNNSLNIGAGILAGSIFPGSNRLIFSGFSPCWGGFYISSMGGAALVFDNLGINMLSILGRASSPSVLYLNRNMGEEIQVEIHSLDINRIFDNRRKGIYGLMDKVLDMFGDRFENDPRILAAGKAALSTDFGAICSCPLQNGRFTHADTWAGRGGFGSKLLREHGITAVIYGGTFVDEDFRDHKVADKWFEEKYNMKMQAKDLESTTKYRFDPVLGTGGTFGSNYASLKGTMFSFNYRSIYLSENDRIDIHNRFILDHYLRQFNEETIKPKIQKTCGEPCAGVCKKLYGEFKKDYEPYQTMGPLSGIFDQRAAERLNHHADIYGFDAISAGGVISWLMECLHEGYLCPEEIGVKGLPEFIPGDFDPVASSMRNAELGMDILDSIIEKRGIMDFQQGARKFARKLSRDKGGKVLDSFVYNANARRGWMVPNQYWTPGVLSPMAIMGKYYMYYGQDFYGPRELGRKGASRFRSELVMDNLGVCRFHRNWAEEMMPEIVDSIFGVRKEFLENIRITSSRINSRNAGIFWESSRNIDIISHFLERKHTVLNNNDKELVYWLDFFKKDRNEAALSFWYDMHKGIQEGLREF